MSLRALASLLFVFAARVAAAEEAPGTSPAKNWVLPLFTKEGYRSMTLHGTEVHPISTARIDVVDLNITVFTGGATAKVESVLLSPGTASFFPDEKIARGSNSVRLLRDDIEVTGEQWTYDHAAKKVSIARHARVTFAASLPDLIK